MLGSCSWAPLGLNDQWLKSGKSYMGPGWAIQLGPSWANLIINLTKYINIIDFIYILDI